MKELPKLRLCIGCGKLFEPTEERQYMRPECREKWNADFEEKKKRIEKEKENECL